MVVSLYNSLGNGLGLCISDPRLLCNVSFNFQSEHPRTFGAESCLGSFTEGQGRSTSPSIQIE